MSFVPLQLEFYGKIWYVMPVILQLICFGGGACLVFCTLKWKTCNLNSVRDISMMSLICVYLTTVSFK